MLNDKDRELIGIGASIAAGCQPCANFHLRAAGIAGASDAEIRQAVNAALSVSRHATEGMARLAAQHSGAPISEPFGCQEKPLVGELVSISAACAVNSVPDLETHITAARRLGATEEQILSAIKIASAVKGTAEGKVQEATGRAMAVTPVESEDCCHPSAEKVSEQAVRAAAEARSGIGDCSPQCGNRSQVESQHN
jgi:AhpD family alkylhydroperoxidase